MSSIAFAKYESLLNDFCVVEKSVRSSSWTRRQAAAICDRRRGVGADGLIILGEPVRGTRSFTLFNADGSSAEWSGNGVRCAAAHSHRVLKLKSVSFETGAGLVPVSVGPASGRDIDVTFTGKTPTIGSSHQLGRMGISVAEGPFPVDAGNPHWVFLVRSFAFDWENAGALCQTRPRGRRGVNVEFVRVVSRKRIEMRIYERGVGPTPSSGSGALAAASVLWKLGLIASDVVVASPGGAQVLSLGNDGASVTSSAPARFLFEGVWPGPSAR